MGLVPTPGKSIHKVKDSRPVIVQTNEDAAGAPLVGVIPAGIGKDPEAVQQTARNLGETQ